MLIASLAMTQAPVTFIRPEAPWSVRTHDASRGPVSGDTTDRPADVRDQCDVSAHSTVSPGHEPTFPRKRLVKSCTKRFRGDAVSAVAALRWRNRRVSGDGYQQFLSG